MGAGSARCALVTRPRVQGEDWQRQLAVLGVKAELLPLIDILPAPDTAAIGRWFGTISGAAVVMFVSPNAAACLFDALPPGWAWPAATLAAATGPGTVAVLRQRGVPAEAIVAPAAQASQFDSEVLWAVLSPRLDWAGRRAAIVRGDGGRDWLAGQLRTAGAHVEFVQAYARAAPRWGDAERDLLARALEQPGRYAWLLSSSEALDHLQALAPEANWQGALALASHPRIGESARRHGFGRVVEVSPSPQAVAEALASLPSD